MNTKKDLLALQLGDLVEGLTWLIRQPSEVWLVTRVLTKDAAAGYSPDWLTKAANIPESTIPASIQTLRSRETPIYVVEFQSSSDEALAFVVLDVEPNRGTNPHAKNHIGELIAANGELVDALRSKSLDEYREQGTKFNVVFWMT